MFSQTIQKLKSLNEFLTLVLELLKYQNEF